MEGCLNNIISIKNLSYTYMKNTPFEKKALDDISLVIKEGEFVALIGHTGSGKSTLVQHLNGLLKLEEGEIEVAGMQTKGKDIKELRKQVGIVFQYPEHQLFEETVYKDIEFGLIKQEIEKKDRDKKVIDIAKLLQIEDLLDKSPYELSGGQKRRVAIAGILVLEPKILVLDEPAAGLDPLGTRELFDIVTSIYKKKGITVILVSHSMELVADYASRIIVMNRGRVYADDKPAVIFQKRAEMEKIGLGIPQITALMLKLAEKHPDIKTDIFKVEDAIKEIRRRLGEKE